MVGPLDHRGGDRMAARVLQPLAPHTIGIEPAPDRRDTEHGGREEGQEQSERGGGLEAVLPSAQRVVVQPDAPAQSTDLRRLHATPPESPAWPPCSPAPESRGSADRPTEAGTFAPIT